VVTEGPYLTVEAVALILVVVAVLAALSALVLERTDIPERLATRLFWALLLVIWVALCIVLLLIRNAIYAT
jgi:hypothetical protein